jgi:nucleotide-binding universal stress UspA family protein
MLAGDDRPAIRTHPGPHRFSAGDRRADRGGQAVLVEQQYIDYAPASLRSVALASELARLSGGTLVLLHVTPPLAYSSMYTGSLTVGLSQQVMAEVHKAAYDTSIAALKVVAERHCQGFECELVARPGVPLSVILGEAEARAVGPDRAGGERAQPGAPASSSAARRTGSSARRAARCWWCRRS